MKRSIAVWLPVLSFGLVQALVHSGVERGPHCRRLLKSGKDETLQGEATWKEGRFHVALRYKSLKPVPMSEQALVVTSSSRNMSERTGGEREGDQSVFAAPKSESYLLAFQRKEGPQVKAITARGENDAAICSRCKSAERLCNSSPAKTTRS